MGNFIIGNKSIEQLKLNESISTKEQYILQGVFAKFNEMNRNSRIYTAEEYLPHLQYLRKDISEGEALLGELDHPEDRFEVSLQNASHQVIDLWYDEANECVMGKIKLLDTPSGKIAKALVDDGVPLHISSRAAGSVDPQSHKVSIQQIFTFDLVCKPGFSAAVLHRVNESASTKKYSQDTMNFLSESVRHESLNQAPQFNMMNENIMIREMFSNVKLRPEAQNIDINNKINIKDMTNKLFEDEVAKPLVASDNAAAAMGIEQPSMTLETSTDDSMDNNQPAENPNENPADDKNQENSDDKLILSVKPEFNEENLIISVKPEFNDEAKEDEEPSDEDKNKEESSAEDDKADESAEDKEEVEKTDDNTLNDKLAEEKEKLEKSKSKVLDKIDDLLGNIKKKNEAKESEIAKYPFAAQLSESNFKKFSNLNYEQKDKVANYLVEQCIVGSDAINRSWEDVLLEKTNEEPIWLKNASAEYRELYENASEQEKLNLARCADYLVFESQYDIDEFWKNSNLKAKSEYQKLNESLNKLAPNIDMTPKNELPYSQDFINEIMNQTMAI